MKWYTRAILWLLPYVIACAVFAGLFWLGALLVAHFFGLSVKDSALAILRRNGFYK